MKRKNIFIIIACALVSMFTFLTACGSQAKTEITTLRAGSKTGNSYLDKVNLAYYFDILGDDVMPIAGWVSPPTISAGHYETVDMVTWNNYMRIKQSGINVVIGHHYDQLHVNDPSQEYAEAVQKALDYCEEMSMVYLIELLGINGMSEAQIREKLAPYMDEPAFGGMHVLDEPSIDYFPTLKATQDKLKNIIPNKLHYFNLFPSYAPDYALYDSSSGSGRWYYHAKAFVDRVGPSMLSYDYYPFDMDNHVNGVNGWFGGLTDARRASIEGGIPFWPFIQACGWSGSHRDVTETEIRWQVNTALAYGAKGIEYFTMYMPSEAHGSNFTTAMFDRNGNALQKYLWIKSINSDIQAIDQYLMKAVSKAIIKVGNSPFGVPTEPLQNSYGVLASASGSNHIIGGFEYHSDRNQQMFYVVNNSTLASTTTNTITLNFNRQVSGKIIYKGQTTTFSGTSKTLDITPAYGALIIID